MSRYGIDMIIIRNTRRIILFNIINQSKRFKKIINIREKISLPY